MVTPANFEDIMKDYESQMKINSSDKKKLKEKAIKDVIFVLKQHGYDSGANIFERIMYEQ